MDGSYGHVTPSFLTDGIAELQSKFNLPGKSCLISNSTLPSVYVTTESHEILKFCSDETTAIPISAQNKIYFTDNKDQ